MQKRNETLWDVFRTRAAKRALGIGIGLQVSQQLSGVNIIIFFSVPIFIAAGSQMDPSDCAIVVAGVQMVSTLLATLLVERAGRRTWLMLSLSSMGACLVVLGIYFHLMQHSVSPLAEISWVPLVAMCTYLITCSLGTAPLPWAMIGELFPSEIKGVASSVCGGVNWLLCFVVSKTFSDLVLQIGPDVTFWMYAGFCFLFTLWVCFFVIETRNKPLLQIQKELEGRRRQEPVY